MRILRVLVVVAALPLGVWSIAQPASAQPAPAQQSPSPEALQAARDLVSFVSTSVMAELTASSAQAWPPLEETLRTQNPNLDAVTLAELHSEFDRLMLGSLADIMRDAPAIYARHFTAQEMRDIVAFYRTPAGTKMLRTMPLATSELFQMIGPRVQGLQQKVNLSFLNILQKRGFYAQ